MSKEVAEEYASSLADLTVNSKPLINMLTILAEENIDHAGVIVETVEKHLEKVQPDIKLPVLYLVDSIIKNVGEAYTSKFSQSIVNMFTRTFKQVIVDEKIRSQMFKLRETWHDVFPATKLYQLDVKVNLIDPAWPIQAQPQQSNIHVNPNFLKKNVLAVPTTSTTTVSTVTPTPSVPPEDDEKMRSILAKKEQELLMLQRKKVEMELEQMRRQIAEKTVVKKVTSAPTTSTNSITVASVAVPVQSVAPEVAPVASLPVKARLGPPVNKPASRIAPVSAALVAARRDPRLARHAPPVRAAPTPPPVAVVAPAAPAAPLAAIAPNVFDIKPLEHVTKRKNVITIDVRPDGEAARAPSRDPRRNDPRLDKRDPRRARPREERRREELRRAALERNNHADAKPQPERGPTPAYVDKMPDAKKISKMPPIPKISRAQGKRDGDAIPAKRKREATKAERRRRRVEDAQKEPRAPAALPAPPAPPALAADSMAASELVTFKELRHYNKEHYMRRNRQQSDSPEPPAPPAPATSAPEVVTENKDVDLRVLPTVVAEAKAATVTQKRSSTEALESKSKKAKVDKFDVLFGNEDVDLRQLPQVDELNAPPPPNISSSPKSDGKPDDVDVDMSSPPKGSPKRDWNEIKKRDDKKTPSKLDLVRAKFAEVTKGKDRLGRPLLFSKSPSVERERRRTMSGDDTEIREEEEQGFVENKKSISIIMSQAKEHLTDGQLDKNQYNTLMYQILQLNEKLKLKEAKQRESLEISKRRLKAHTLEENHKVSSPKSSPTERNRFGDIDERITPSVFLDTPPDSQGMIPTGADSDMRVNSDGIDGPPKQGLLPLPPVMPMFGPYPPMWRGPRARGDDYGHRRFRGPAAPPFFRGKFDKRGLRGMPFDSRMPMPPLPTPKIGMCQGKCPLPPYERSESPPPLGAPGFAIPPTDFNVLEYIDQDPFKTIQIDGVPREIRFYGDTAVIMLEWDDPREIKFLPGCRRVTFDNKDSIVLSFNENYKKVEIEDQVFDIKFGAPTRELFINGRWYECFFGGQPLGVIIDGKPRLVHLEGPMPQVDIGKVKRTDLVAGKINLIVNATQMHPVYLDAKVQKVLVMNGQFLTVRFVDSLRTVLINGQPFKVEFGDLPKPIVVGNEKYFIRFSALPRNIKPGYIQIANMEGVGLPLVPHIRKFEDVKEEDVTTNRMDVEQQEPANRPIKTPSPEMNPESLGLDMLASVMPSSTVEASGSDYSTAEPLFFKPENIPGLETPKEEKPAPALSLLPNINVNDLFAKLVATGIVQVKDGKEENVAQEEAKPEEKVKPREDKNVIHKVDFMRIETFRVKQPGLVSRLYGGMQCSGCGARFPPEHTVRYSQHLDWHFRQNRRDRDSARRAHSRHWHYDLSDWVQYEEVEDLEEREKSWFETGGLPAGGAAEGAAEAPAPAPVVMPSAAASAPAHHACALCGDTFQQFYNEDKEEWHLRNSVKHNDDYYHPACFDDYKASLNKAEEQPSQESSDDVTAIENKIEEEAIEIKDVEDDPADQSDNESVVEVVEEPKDLDPVEIDEGEEDDVVFKAEPVVEVVVDDEVDTDDETTAERKERDRLADIDFSNIRVKQEPIDPDDEPIVTAEEEPVQAAHIDNTQVTVESSIDGNLQLDAAHAPTTTNPIRLGGIRINISKALPTFVSNHDDKQLEDISADDEPLPPGEEPELQYTLKPGLEGVQLSRQPPVNRGTELSGLCSIM